MADLKKLSEHPALQKPLNTVAKQEFATPFFVLRETLVGFTRHNIMGLSASLSFYALFALIPLALLIFFLLSHLVYSSDYAIVKLAIVMGNLIPDFSSKVMTEVYNTTQTKAAWGVVGLIVLLWSITPLASAMRSCFYTIASKVEAPSFFMRKLKDIVSVLGILLLFFLFTSAGFLLEKAIRFLATHFSPFQLNIVGIVFTLVLTTILIAAFYRVFFPIRVALIHLCLGALMTAVLWLLMRPAFGLFLSLNQGYGAVFGSMKALFVSITWLYLNFAVFLFGSEFIATLRKKDVLLLKGLFDNLPNKANYIEALMSRYGVTLSKGNKIIEQGNSERNLYFIVSGTVHISKHGVTKRILQTGDYFGEIAMLAEQPANADAIVVTDEAQIIVIDAENIDSMMADDPKVAMQLLKHLAIRLQNNTSE